jgi:hypothetical protein
VFWHNRVGLPSVSETAHAFRVAESLDPLLEIV